jgi:transcriptional regulator with XRE-family HTH domain
VSNTQSVAAEKIALVVKARRRSLGLSQEELAHGANIDRTYASQIERAIANPSLGVLCSLADVLQLTLSQLIGEAAIE